MAIKIWLFHVFWLCESSLFKINKQFIEDNQLSSKDFFRDQCLYFVIQLFSFSRSERTGSFVWLWDFFAMQNQVVPLNNLLVDLPKKKIFILLVDRMAEGDFPWFAFIVFIISEITIRSFQAFSVEMASEYGQALYFFQISLADRAWYVPNNLRKVKCRISHGNPNILLSGLAFPSFTPANTPEVKTAGNVVPFRAWLG